MPRKSHALQLLSHVKGNSHSLSSLPVLPIESVSLHRNTPVMGAIPLELCDPNKITALQLHVDL